jgi:hypothetical protein
MLTGQINRFVVETNDDPKTLQVTRWRTDLA